MNKKDMLLEYLKKQAGEYFIPAKRLANSLGVTDRTIRNYVKYINDKHPNLIESSGMGYRLSENISKVVKETESGSHIDNRRFYILRRLIKSSKRGLDLFDLADTLYVSDATIRSDIANLNQFVTRHSLQIIQQDNRYYLEGGEKSRRKFMIDLIYYSKPTKGSLEEEIQLFLGNIPLQELMNLSRKTFEKYGIHLNTYLFKNFILHLAIAVNRVSDNEQLDQSSYTIDNRNSKSFNIVNEIASDLYKQYHIRFSQADKDELVILFNGQLKNDLTLMNDYTNINVYNALENAIQEISEVYMINFDDDNFKTRLLIHIQNLYNRRVQNKYTRNLSVLNIRVKYPVIFDVSVYLSSVLSNELDIQINDDEISFIALHIGSYLNSQPDEDYKIKTVIITPSYLSQQNDIQQIIEKHFNDDLIVVGIYEDTSYVNSLLSPELIITTEGVEQLGNNFFTTNTEIVSTREFMKKHDRTLIRQAIEKIRHHNYSNFLKNKLPELVREKFLVNIYNHSSKAQIMETITEVFQENGYVDNDYLRKLNEREQVSSTAFPSGVAIPHTMKYEAKKTGLMVLKPKSQMNWGSTEVRLIIGIAVNKEDSHIFNIIFPRIIELVSKPYNVNYLVGADKRYEFINRLIELMTDGNYFPE